MKNKYEIQGDITYIFLTRRDGTILKTIIDTEDLEKILKHNYSLQADYKKNVKSYYALMYPKILLHRFIMNAPEGKLVDHINHNTLDNRKENLRICTYSENNQNKKGALITSKSGIRGVCYDKHHKNWIAAVRKERKTVFRKTFDSIEEAAQAVVEARQKYLNIGQAVSNT